MSDIKALMPQIKKAAIVHGVLLLYFLSPGFLSFVAILAAIAFTFVKNPSEMCSKSDCEEKCCIRNCSNKCFQNFRSLDIVEQLLVLFGLYILINLIWFIPSNVIIFLGAETFVACGFLKQLGVCEQINKYRDLALANIQKVISLIPRYQPNQ